MYNTEYVLAIVCMDGKIYSKWDGSLFLGGVDDEIIIIITTHYSGLFCFVEM